MHPRRTQIVKLFGTIAGAFGLMLIMVWLLSGAPTPIVADVPQPLGEHCIGVGPDIPPDWCGCTWGFVNHEGEIVSGAVVSVTFGGGVVTTTTGYGEFETEPYYALNAGDLGAQVGDPLTVTVSYSDQQQSKVVIANPDALGEQQVDVPTVLGEHCIGVGPVDEEWCGCTWGFVSHRGEIVSSAVVSVSFGGGVVTTTTGYGEFETEPYYALNAGELGAHVGDPLTVTVSYSGQHQSKVVIADPDALGEQQVDVPTVLGEHCIGVGPVDEDWCGCLWGTVTYNGTVVAGAVVTLTFNGEILTTTTGLGDFETEPYYALNADGLGAQAGDFVTVSFAYEGQTQSQGVQLAPDRFGEQRVDGEIEGEGWRIECVDCPNYFSDISDRSLRLDTDGQPHIVYGSDDLYYAWFDGTSWHYETVDESPTYGTQLYLDDLGNPHISYADTYNRVLKYAYWTGEAWDIQILDEDLGIRSTSLALDSIGRPHISYSDDTNDNLNYARWTGNTWDIQTVDSEGDMRDVSLALDNADNPHISYHDSTNGGNNSLKYACWTGSAWDIQIVDSVGDVGFYNSLVLDSMSYPHIGYYEVTNNNLKYARWTGSAWNIQTVDSTGDVGHGVSLALDSAENPHISYRDFTNYSIKYAYWTDVAWNIVTVDSHAHVAFYTSLTLDDVDTPYISYCDRNDNELRYTYWTGSSWEIQTVDRSGSVGANTSLALDSMNNPHIGYYDGSSQEIRYARFINNTWDFQSVDHDDGLGFYLSLYLDRMDNSHISYHGPTDLRYARHTNNVWDIQTVDSSWQMQFFTSLAVDSTGKPHIVYYDSVNGDLRYAHWTGTEWDSQIVDSEGDVGRFSSLALDNLNNPHISYYDAINGDLKFAHWTGSSWSIDLVDTEGDVGLLTCLALDSADNPHISYHDTTSESLEYAYWSGTGWNIQTVDNEGDTAYPTSLALDSKGNPHISYYDTVNSDLKYARWGVNSWEIQIVDSNGDVGSYSSLALDSVGNPHISYYDGSNGDLKYAYYVSALVPSVSALDVAAFSPLANEHTTSRSTQVSATYNQSVDLSTINTRTFAVRAMQTGLLTQTYTVDDDTATLTPSQPFHPGELVQATVTTGTQSLSGAQLVTPTVWQFRAGVEGGSGVFVDSGQRLGDSYPWVATLGDLDNDGDLDAFLANGSDQANEVWLNNAQGLFNDSGQRLGNLSSESAALGDMDNDGDLDVFVGNTAGDQPNKVWLNDGSGTFTDSEQDLGGQYSVAVSLGDVDGDGDMDAFVANWSGQANRVWLNDGAGGFTDSGQDLGEAWSLDVALGDVDGDSDLDAFVANATPGHNKVWLNDGTGVFSDSFQNLGNSNSRDVALGDLDLDGDLDAFVTNQDYQANKVWLNDGHGLFTDSGQSIEALNSQSVALGDIDADGDLDAFVGNLGPVDEIWLNDGVGNFEESGQSLGHSESYVALGDLDGDGDLDALLARESSEVWLNQNPTCHVRLNDSPNTYPSVQAAVDAAQEGDMVKVAGYCAGVESRVGLTQTVYLSKSLRIQGGYTLTNWTTPDPVANPTTLDAQRLGRVFYIAGNISPTIEGLRITGGNAYTPDIYDRDGGGGIFIQTPKINIHNCRIYSNTAMRGGGIYIESDSWANFQEADIVNTVVSVNGSNVEGSGLYIHGSYYTSGTLNSEHIVVRIEHSTFLDHDENLSIIAISGGAWPIALFQRKKVAGLASLVQQPPPPPSSDSHCCFGNALYITNTIFSSNHAAGIEVYAGDNIVQGNGILWHNVPITVAKTYVTNGFPITLTIKNEYYGDPAFAYDGYHLTANSAALDRGGSTEVIEDIDGDPRPMGLAPDLGADELDAEHVCYVRLNETSAYYPTVQDAVDASRAPTDVVKIAGACAGRVTVDKPLTLRGGYAQDDWTTPDFEGRPATLDAQEEGSALTISGTTVTVEGLRLTGGSAVYGGGLRVEQSAVTLTQSVLRSNVATYGGGLYANVSRLTLTRNHIADNQAYSGGGLYVVNSPTTTLRANTIVANAATFQGGGLLLDDTGSPMLINTVVAANQAYREGGGLYIAQSDPKLLHTTVAQNEGASGIFVTANAAPELLNTILVSHTVGISVTADSTAVLKATLWGSDAWANERDGCSTGSPLTGTLNVWGTPGFANPAHGDYRLTSGSLAINQGLDLGVTVDHEGEPRPQGYGYDLGADEAPPSTLILVNESRMTAYHDSAEVQALMADLPILAAHPYANGLIVDVGTQPTVTAALVSWDTAPADQDLANAATDAIQAVITAYRQTYPNLAYVVLVGDDQIFPHRRVPLDAYSSPQGGWAPESHYVGSEINSTVEHALSQDMTLTDDFYVDLSPDPWQGRALYVPDLAIGRLVETPTEIQAAVQAFLDLDGLLVVDTAAVAGYDFVTDAAQDVCVYLNTTGIVIDCSLINETWTAQDFINLLLNNEVAWGLRVGHARHNLLAAPAGSEGIAPAQIALSDLLWGTFRADNGCHAGLNDAASVDLAQTHVGRGTAYLAGTGWTYGFKETIGLSERLLLLFTRTMLDTEARTSLGQSLTAAKQIYRATEGRFDHHDEKTLSEFVLYGLPMLRVQVAPGTGSPPEPQIPYTSRLYLSPELAHRAGAGDAITTSLPPTTAMKTYHVSPAGYTAVTEPEGTYYTLYDRYQANTNLPVLPEFNLGLQASVGPLRVPLFISATYTVLENFDPYIEQAVGPYTTTLPEPEFSAPGWWPHPLYTTAGRPGQRLNLLVTPGQLHSAQGVFRLYDDLAFQAFYAGSTDLTPPTLENIQALHSGGELSVTVAVTDPIGIHRVLLTYDAHAGRWKSVDLAWNAGRETWEGTISVPQNVDFFVQAVDNAGNVVHSLSQGDTASPVISAPVYASTVADDRPLTVTAEITEGLSLLPTGVATASLVLSDTATPTPTVIGGTQNDGTWAFVIPPQGQAQVGHTLHFALTACDQAVPPNCAVNDNGESFYSVLIESSVLTYSIPLMPDVNFISLPLHPDAITITEVLAPLAGNYTKVYAYDGCDPTEQWKTYEPDKPPFVNTLHTLDETTSFWIRMTTTDTLVITGTVSSATPLTLCTGLNMPGYPSLQTRPITEALTSIAGLYTKVYAYDAHDAAEQWKTYDPNKPPFVNTLTAFVPGGGYWIAVTEECTWTPN